MTILKRCQSGWQRVFFASSLLSRVLLGATHLPSPVLQGAHPRAGHLGEHDLERRRYVQVPVPVLGVEHVAALLGGPGEDVGGEAMFGLVGFLAAVGMLDNVGDGGGAGAVGIGPGVRPALIVVVVAVVILVVGVAIVIPLLVALSLLLIPVAADDVGYLAFLDEVCRG